MALFCDFENVALGVRDTRYQKFDIRPVLERLLLKGSIVVKKAYCDWERYKNSRPHARGQFRADRNPHVRQSGKNSADIRLVVDALDLCYTKSHVNTFVIISGDSDFSPLVSKLRENDKKVIGVGVKQSTSDLLIANCDEFIFYDDLAREGQRAAESRRDSRDSRGAGGGQRRTPEEERRRKEEQEARKTQAVELVVETFDALMAERGDGDRIWASVLKDALKRRKPDFNESYYGFRAFGNLLEEAQSRGFLDVGREEKSGTYVYRDSAHGVRRRARACAPRPCSRRMRPLPPPRRKRPPNRRKAPRGVRAAARRRARGAGRAAIASAAAAVTPSVRRMMWRRMATANRRRTPRAPRPCYRGRMLNPGKASRRKRRRIPRQRRLRVHAAVASRAGPAFGRRRACAGRQPGNAGWFGRCRPARRRPGDRAGRQARRQDPRRAAGRARPRRRATPWPPTTVRLATRPALPRRRPPLPPTRRRRTRPSPRADRRASASSAQDGRVLGRLSPVAVPGAGSATRRPARSVPASRHARA